MKFKILAINPGSTSTKIAVYENEERIFTESVEHSYEQISKYESIQDQLLLRKNAVIAILDKYHTPISALSAIVGRGGILPPVKSGAYLVNDVMIDRLANRPLSHHASNFGALIACDIGKPFSIPSYIYDPVSVDEMSDIARVTGLPEIKRRSQLHALNMRAVAMKTARALNQPYEALTFIVAHLGGGISLSLHTAGKMIDIISDDEGPFAPERSGRLPALLLTDLCYSGKYSHEQMKNIIRGGAGLKAYFGTSSLKEIEDRITNGDEHAKLLYRAMAYNVAKGIGELATVVSGSVDRIILTGGIAHSETFTGLIAEKVRYIAPVTIMAGEDELEALAYGILRCLRNQEKAMAYTE